MVVDTRVGRRRAEEIQLQRTEVSGQAMTTRGITLCPSLRAVLSRPSREWLKYLKARDYTPLTMKTQFSLRTAKPGVHRHHAAARLKSF